MIARDAVLLHFEHSYCSPSFPLTARNVSEEWQYMHYEWTPEQKANEDLLKRKNFTLVPLDQSKDLLSRSQNNTTIEAQTRRITNRLNTYTPVSIVSSESITIK